MTNENTVTPTTTSTPEVKPEKKMGSGEWMRLELMKGWKNPSKGMYPAAMVEHVLKEWKTGKTKINDLYFQANKIRKEVDGFADLKIRDYVKKIEDSDGTTAKKEKEQKEKDAVKAKEKAEKEQKAEAEVKKSEEKKAA